MAHQKPNNTVVVAPLDWGLGHATRCIPVIRALMEKQYTVLIVTSGRPLLLLKKEFPDAMFYDLPSYNIYYQKRGSFLIKLTVQLRKILGGIMREKRETKRIIEAYRPCLIISDNRYGVRSAQIRTVFISHQMMIKIPGARWIEWLVHRWLDFQHRRFHAIWIPDTEGHPNLSGDLGHTAPTLSNARFIGLLNRFEMPDQLPELNNDILCILSGPEPQRSIFEKKILQQAPAIKRKIIIVQGISEERSDKWVSDHIRIIAHADARQLTDLILQSRVVISRGGYTTLMDLASMGKHCIFVPTPGQTEQEYLVEELANKNLCVHTVQKHFSLDDALKKLESTDPFYLPIDSNTFLKELEHELSLALES